MLNVGAKKLGNGNPIIANIEQDFGRLSLETTEGEVQSINEVEPIFYKKCRARYMILKKIMP